jgi:hypothetical protein
MALHLFHQNMRTFGGGTSRDGYNDRMADAFWQIPLGLPGSPVIAAGFTEIKNNKTANDALAAIVRTLDPRLTDVRTVAVGRTAALKKAKKGKKRKDTDYPQEFVTMVAANGPGCQFVVEDWGKSVYTRDKYDKIEASCFPVGVEDGLHDYELPTNAVLDSRGVGYLVGRIKRAGDPLNNKRLIVCFMHNMYSNGERSGGFTGVPKLMSAIYTEHQLDPDVIPCILGGDMNVRPRRTGGGRRGIEFVPIGEKDGADEYLDTTNCSVYDWWACHVNTLDDVEALIHTETRQKDGPDTLSDHAGISISLAGSLWWA